MRLNEKALLSEILQAGQHIQQFTAEKNEHDFAGSLLLRSAVERQFEIVGEALNRLGKNDSSLLESIRNYRRIIAFRNILAHDYDRVDEGIVWDIIQRDLPVLLEDAAELLAKDE